MVKTTKEFCQQVLRSRMDSFLKKLRSLESKMTGAGVHKTRVDSRRMRATLDAFQELFPPRPFGAVYREIRSVTRILGGPREIAVTLGLVRELEQNELTEDSCLKYLRKKFVARLKKQEKKLQRKLAGIDLPRLRSRLEFLISVIESDELHRVRQTGSPALRVRRRRRISHSSQDTLFPMSESAVEHAARVFQKVAAPISEFRTDRQFKAASDEELHSLRISAKKVRYAMEIFSSAWRGGLKDCIEKARKLQEAGGKYNDWSVLCRCFNEEIKRLNSSESVHLAFQIGRLAALAELRKEDLKVDMREALMELQRGFDVLAGRDRTQLKLKFNAPPMIPAYGPRKKGTRPNEASKKVSAKRNSA
jgi:CHAD domain-containing protein